MTLFIGNFSKIPLLFNEEHRKGVKKHKSLWSSAVVHDRNPSPLKGRYWEDQSFTWASPSQSINGA
jgi:hypothetical protein